MSEEPPGPPGLSAKVAEIYGPDPERQLEVAAQVKGVFETTAGVVDIDCFVEEPQPKIEYRIDAERLCAYMPKDIELSSTPAA